MSKKRLNSRNKGNTYERKIAKILSNAWGFPIVRTPNSGAFKKLAPADIIPEDRKVWNDFIFHLECKHRKNWALEQLLREKAKCPVLTWYLEEEQKQVKAVGKKFYEKCMLLIFTKNYDVDYVMFRLDNLFSFPLSLPLECMCCLVFQDVPYEYCIMTLKEFLKHLDYEECQKRYIKWLKERKEMEELVKNVERVDTAVYTALKEARELAEAELQGFDKAVAEVIDGETRE